MICDEIVSWVPTALKNMLAYSKNHTAALKFARKLSPGHQRVTVHQNSTQKHAQWVENPLGTLRFN